MEEPNEERHALAQASPALVTTLEAFGTVVAHRATLAAAADQKSGMERPREAKAWEVSRNWLLAVRGEPSFPSNILGLTKKPGADRPTTAPAIQTHYEFSQVVSPRHLVVFGFLLALQILDGSDDLALMELPAPIEQRLRDVGVKRVDRLEKMLACNDVTLARSFSMAELATVAQGVLWQRLQDRPSHFLYPTDWDLQRLLVWIFAGPRLQASRVEGTSDFDVAGFVHRLGARVAGSAIARYEHRLGCWTRQADVWLRWRLESIGRSVALMGDPAAQELEGPTDAWGKAEPWDEQAIRLLDPLAVEDWRARMDAFGDIAAKLLEAYGEAV